MSTTTAASSVSAALTEARDLIRWDAAINTTAREQVDPARAAGYAEGTQDALDILATLVAAHEPTDTITLTLPAIPDGAALTEAQMVAALTPALRVLSAWTRKARGEAVA